MKLSPIPLSLQQLVEALKKADGRIVRFELPTTTLLSPHVHVTEVARIDKKFVDWGGPAGPHELACPDITNPP
jgi:hypothetical protein